MSKFILMLIFLCGTQLYTYAQGHQIEAIAAYQMAEEQFGAGNYSQALGHVETAKKALGIANSKILYLQIQIMNEMGKTDVKYIEQGLETIQVFEKAPDISQFSQEKRVEIAKMKISMNGMLALMEEADRKTAELNTKRDQAISTFFTTYPKPGIYFDEFLQHPYVHMFNFHNTTGSRREFRRGSKGQRGDHFFSNNKQEEKTIISVSTNSQGMIEAYIIAVELDNSTDGVEHLKLLGPNASISDLLVPTKTKRLLSDNMFSAFELKNSREDTPYIVIDSNIRTTSYKLKRQGKKDYIRYAWIYVYNN